MNVHELKTWPKYFDEIKSRKKTFEIRKNDRDFKINDILHLRRFTPMPDGGYYHCDSLICVVTYILAGEDFGVKEGYCVMGIKLLHSINPKNGK